MRLSGMIVTLGIIIALFVRNVFAGSLLTFPPKQMRDDESVQGGP